MTVEPDAVEWTRAHTIRVGRVSIEVTETSTESGPRYTFRVGRIAGKPGAEKRSGYLRARDVEDFLAAGDELRDWLVAQDAA